MPSLDIKDYILTSMAMVIFAMGVHIIFNYSEISSLKKDVSDQEVLIEKHKLKEKEQKSAISGYRESEVQTEITILELKKELQKAKNLSSKTDKLHRKEISSNKKLIASMEEEIIVVGNVIVENCSIQIEEVRNESDYISKSINSIGF